MHPTLDRISVDPKILGGRPVIRGTRIPVSILLQMLRDGASFAKIIEEYPRLSREDIQAALDYSVRVVDHLDEELIPVPDGG